MVQAINSALRESMREDGRVIVLGEDVGKNGGVFRATERLLEEFGPRRVIDTPLSELGIVGVSTGMSIYGMKPVAEIEFADYIYSSLDQIISMLSKLRFRTAGEFQAPIVIRTPYGAGIKGGIYHSQSPLAYFVHTAGLYVVVPSDAYDAKGLLISSIRANDPVIFFEPKKLYRHEKGEVPEGSYQVPLGVARLAEEGDDLTLIAYGSMVQVCKEALKQVTRNVRADVIDLRTLLPYDGEAILRSVEKTGRVVIVHEEPRTCGVGAEIAAFIAEKAILHLKAPIMRVTGLDSPVPLFWEDFYLPSSKNVAEAIDHVMGF
jgi:pyruvate/2-oxoglutarate/acetoin dehydrogenase E1 component